MARFFRCSTWSEEVEGTTESLTRFLLEWNNLSEKKKKEEKG